MYTHKSTCGQGYKHLQLFTLFVVKMYYDILPLTLFVDLSRFIPIKAPVYKDISIFKCARCFVLKVYYNFDQLTLFVELRRFIPIKAPVYKDIRIFNFALCFVVKVSYNFIELTYL